MRQEDFGEIKGLERTLPLLLSYFSSGNDLQKGVEIIGTFIASWMPVHTVGIVQFTTAKVAKWKSTAHVEDGKEISWLMEHAQELVQFAGDEGIVKPEAFAELSNVSENAPLLLYVVRYDDKPRGLLFVRRDGGDWRAWEKERVCLLGAMMSATISARLSRENEKLENFVFNTILDYMKTSIYVTDIETDRILFMNRAMKEAFGLEDPVGKICWQVLQRGLNEKCSFCPIEQLQKRKKENEVIQWEEVNTVTGRTYQNYDSLIFWVDGKTVHLQQSMDVTELKLANTDELTMMLTRRPGKCALQATLAQVCAENRMTTVCLYDINLLKEVNDLHGHAEGDRMIATIASAIKEVLFKGEYAFRLSGDEFVVVFHVGKKEAQRRMKNVLRKLRSMQAKYQIGFCYGLVEISQGQCISVDEALFLADTRMYEQKRRFHILRNEQRRNEAAVFSGAANFTYDKEKLYDALVQSTDDYLYLCNMKTGVFRYARAMVEEFDLPGEIIENAAAIWGAKVHESDQAAFLEANQEIIDGRTNAHCVEYRAKNRHGEWVWVRCRGRVEFDEHGEPTLFAGFITNLGKKNTVDHLTGLFNKVEFESEIKRLIAEPNQKLGLMLLGMDDLKHINDLYDRAFGDEVIRLAARRLQVLLPSDSSIYRLDGDEFGIVMRDANLERMQKLYRTIYHTFENQQEYDQRKYYSTFSAGCLFYPQEADNFLDLMKYAGYSLEYAKKHGKKRCVFFSQEILGHRSRALAMLEALRESVENDFYGFSLLFQPLVEANQGVLVGAEALARWQCKEFGQVSPVEFIPLLEESGLIVPVGKWVFRTALKTCKRWNIDNPDFTLDVNLSYLQLEGADFVPFLREVLREEQYLPKNLVVELTESYFAKENRHVQEVFAELRQMGIRIAMDDFGTGYSTLGLLKGAPADIVKIDKTFIRDIHKSNFDATFIRFVVALCHDVGIKVCLEGVETPEEYEAISKMGLDMIQGFLFDRPLTEREFGKKYLEKNNRQ